MDYPTGSPSDILVCAGWRDAFEEAAALSRGRVSYDDRSATDDGMIYDSILGTIAAPVVKLPAFHK